MTIRHATTVAAPCFLRPARGEKAAFRDEINTCDFVRFSLQSAAMAYRRKSWTEKLADHKGLPKVSRIEGKLSKRWGEGTVVIPAPREVDEMMRQVPRG